MAQSHLGRSLTRRALLALAVASPTLLAGCKRDPVQDIYDDFEGDDSFVPDEGGMTVDENAINPTYTPVLKVGGVQFSGSFEDNPTVDALIDRLPITMDMRELNGNEKYCYLDEPLPSAPEAVGHIEAGDIMLFGDDCIVVFYDSFDTQYSYTRIGSLGLPNDGDLDRLREALGAGDVTCELWVEWSE